MRRHRCGERFGARWRGTQPRHRDASGSRPRVTKARCLRGWTRCRFGRGKSPSACAGSCALRRGREFMAQPSRRRQAIRQSNRHPEVRSPSEKTPRWSAARRASRNGRPMKGPCAERRSGPLEPGSRAVMEMSRTRRKSAGAGHFAMPAICLFALSG